MVIDTGAGVSQNVLSFVMAADEIIVVTTPEPTAITDAYGIIKSIAAQSPDKIIKIIVNRVQSVAEGNRVAQRVINIAGQFLNIKVENLGFIFDDIYVPKSVRNQKPFIVSYPKSKASGCIAIIADRISNKTTGTAKGSGLASFLRTCSFLTTSRRTSSRRRRMNMLLTVRRSASSAEGTGEAV